MELKLQEKKPICGNVKNAVGFFLQQLSQLNLSEKMEPILFRKHAENARLRYIKSRENREKMLLQIDHLHGTFTFRGWLCRECNTGIGSLGDNLEGVLQAAVYLENDKNKIIKTLDKVYNEVFARTA